MQQRSRRPAPAASFSGSAALDHALSGVGGAVVSTMVFHPLDLVKIRLQVDTASHKEAVLGRAMRAARHVVQTDGLAGMYRGLGANLAGNCASWGLYFAWYTWIKGWMAGEGAAAVTATGVSTLSPVQHLAAGAAAGALTQCMANPLWVVKTRVCTTSRSDAGAYRGLVDGLGRIAATEGLRGLYKGLAPGLLGVAHGGLQFMAYEEMKKRRARSAGGRAADSFSSVEYAYMSSSSKVFALAITYPSQVLRSRLQQAPGASCTRAAGAPRMASYSGLGDAIAKTMRAEGPTGFYKGFGPALLRVLPGNIMTFIVYEKIAASLRGLAARRDG
ncbi:mitochondrial FAD carrier protein flx1 [Coemansia biformis]|uniref:Mitochondrial FAD carrier protein flx1 n=1 Tax=Coemansia biformis TaxID=1286918 RepID=A0A9W7YJL1_9FUNG|nr:mitochondrial FAD carrier protein flx1 [Coemansia biformis]